MKLILLRHGESQWNQENRFTGWKDVDLTDKGITEAKFAAEQLKKENIKINSIFTSQLKRAINTTKIVTLIIDYEFSKVKYDWRLNERHYGALQGLNKSETAEKFGEEQVQIWRRSFNIPPPFLSENDKMHPKFFSTFDSIERHNLPIGESLEMVIKRLAPFWEKYFNDIKTSSGCHLIVAHSNSLRAIVKILDNLSEDEIMQVNIPTGIPLVYNFKNDIIVDKKYLINDEDLQKRLDLVIKQGKVK